MFGRRDTMQYNSVVIQQHARELYDQAEDIVLTEMMRGGCAGIVLSLMLVVGWSLIHTLPGYAILAIPAGVVAGSMLGRSRGEQKAFALRLQAQMALCNVAIEQNGRALLSLARRVAGKTGEAGLRSDDADLWQEQG
jgi:hypothetical protein